MFTVYSLIKMISLFLISFIIPQEAARILAMYPTPSVSHQVVFRPLMLELVKKGHEVVVITADPIKNAPKNYSQIDVHDLSYEYWKANIVPKIDPNDSFKLLEAALHGMVNIVEDQLKTKEVQNVLNSNQKFDLIFVEAFMTSCLILSHIFKAPVIQFSSWTSMYPQCEVIGAPSHLMYYPEVIRKRLYDLTLWEKLEAFYYNLKFRHLIWEVKSEENAMLKRVFGPKTPTIDELLYNVDMLFLNVNPIWDDNRPMPPAVVYTGGLHQKPLKDLPTDLKSNLDSSKYGVIYMSFGTNVDPTLLSPERIQIFCKVFSKLPYDVLWKWNGDDLPGKPDNVRISKWLPQSDLLRHPKMKLFITQAGLQSTDEAITAGVPLIAFPMLGDQWYNAEKYEKHGIGMKLDFETVTEKVLEGAIETVIGDERYKKSITRLGALMRDQPQSPLQRAVWWTEHVLRHRGAAHLRCPAANISWTEYLMLDVVLVLLGLALISSLALGAVLFNVLRVIQKILLKYSKLKQT